MSDDVVPFRNLLASAEEQLHWGIEPEHLEDTARALARRQPGSLVAEQLMGRAADLRTALSRFPRHGATAPDAAHASKDAPSVGR